MNKKEDISSWILKDNYRIEIINIRTCGKRRDGHFCGRPTPVGNPFSIKQHGRVGAVAKYKLWLDQQWMCGNEPVKRMLIELATELRDTGEIALRCFCAPDLCHCSVIGLGLLALIKKELI